VVHWLVVWPGGPVAGWNSKQQKYLVSARGSLLRVSDCAAAGAYWYSARRRGSGWASRDVKEAEIVAPQLAQDQRSQCTTSFMFFYGESRYGTEELDGLAALDWRPRVFGG
jgi:hypothetical protein